MKQINNTIKQLKCDPFFCIKIENLTKGRTELNNAFGADIIADYGSIEEYLEELLSNGDEYKIIDRKKNGSSFKTINSYVAKRSDLQAEPAELSHNYLPLMPRLHAPQMGMFGSKGLGMAEIHRSMDHPRLESENRELKSKLEKVTDEKLKLEKELLKYELTEGNTIASKEANAKMVESFSPVLGMIAEKFLSPQTFAPVGLGNPNLSEVKQQTLQLLQQLNDSETKAINLFIDNIDNEGVADGFIKFLKEFKLLQD